TIRDAIASESKSVACEPANAEDNAGVLDSSIREEQFGTDRAHLWSLRVLDHRIHPVAADHLGVVVQKKQKLTARFFGTAVVDGGEIETSRAAIDSRPVSDLFEELQGFGSRAVVVQHDDLIVTVVSFLLNTGQTLAQQLASVFCRDQNRYEWLAADLVSHRIAPRTGGCHGSS